MNEIVVNISDELAADGFEALTGISIKPAGTPDERRPRRRRTHPALLSLAQRTLTASEGLSSG